MLGTRDTKPIVLKQCPTLAKLDGLFTMTHRRCTTTVTVAVYNRRSASGQESA